MKISKKLIKLAEKYAKKECEDVINTLSYEPSAIYHLVKMVFIDGYVKGKQK